MTRRFQQMQAEERIALAAMRLQGMSLRAIGTAMKRRQATEEAFGWHGFSLVPGLHAR